MVFTIPHGPHGPYILHSPLGPYGPHVFMFLINVMVLRSAGVLMGEKELKEAKVRYTLTSQL